MSDNSALVKRITQLERELDRVGTKESPMFYNGKTITVGTAPYLTLQNAVDAWKGATVKKCRIAVPAGTYTLASTLTIESAWNANHPDDMLFVGDNRTIVGESWVQGATCNFNGQGNGGVGTVTLAGALGGATITVTCTTTNPSFSAAGIIAGDLILARLNNGTCYELTVASTAANVITISGTLAAAIGASGSSLTLCPNRIIVSAATGNLIYANGCNFSMLGFYLKVVSTTAGAGALMLSQNRVTIYKAAIRVNGTTNPAAYAINLEDAVLTFADMTNRGYMSGASGQTSILNIGTRTSSLGILGLNSQVFATNTVFINLDVGFQCYYGSYVMGKNSIGVYCTYFAYIGYQTMAEFEAVGTQTGTNGIVVLEQSQAFALNTSAKLVGLTTKYAPATSNVAGNNNSYISWT